MADRIVSWKAIADFQKVQSEAKKTQQSLQDLQKTVDANNAKNTADARTQSQQSSASLAAEQKLSAQRTTTLSQMAQMSQARKTAAADSDRAVKAANDESKAASDLEQASRRVALAENDRQSAVIRTQQALARLQAAEKNAETTSLAHAAAVKQFGASSEEATTALGRHQTALSAVEAAALRHEAATLRVNSATLSESAAHAAAAAAADRHRVAIGNTASGLDGLGADAENAAGRLTRLAEAFANGGSSTQTFGAALGLLKLPLLAAALAQLVPVVLALGASFFSLAAGIAPAAGALASLPTFATAGAFALGTVFSALQGVGGALKAFSAQQKAVSAGGASVANTAIQQAQAIAAAQHQITEAQYAQGLAAQTAQDQTVSSAQSVAQAIHSEAQAQLSLNQAWIDAAKNIRDLQAAAESATLSQQGDALSLTAAKQALQKTLDDPASTALQRAQAQHAVDQATFQLQQSKVAAADSAAASKDATAKGVEGSQSVIDAKYAEEQATIAVTQATHAQAEQAAASAKAQVDAQYNVEMAFQALANAQRAAATNTSAAATAQNAYREALAKLTPEGRTFVASLLSFKTAFKSVSDAAQTATLPGFTSFIRSLQTVLPTLKGVFVDTGHAISDFMRALGQEVASPAWLTSISTLGTADAGIIRTLGDGFRQFLDVMRKVAVAAIPLAQFLANGATAWITHINAVNLGADGYNRLAVWLGPGGRVQSALHSIGQIFKNVGIGIYESGKAAGDAGKSILDSIQNVTEKWAKWTSSVQGQNKMKQYFDDARVVLRDVVGALSDLFGWLGRIGSASGAHDMLTKMGDALAPFAKAVGSLFTGDLGKNLIDIFTQLAKAVSDLTGNGQVLTGIADGISGLVAALDWFVQFPGVADIITGIALAFGVWKVIDFASNALGLRKLTGAVLDYVGASKAASTATLGGSIKAGLGSVGTRTSDLTDAQRDTLSAAGLGVGKKNQRLTQAQRAALGDDQPQNKLGNLLSRFSGRGNDNITEEDDGSGPDATPAASGSRRQRRAAKKKSTTSAPDDSSDDDYTPPSSRQARRMARNTPSLDDVTNNLIGGTNNRLGLGNAAPGAAASGGRHAAPSTDEEENKPSKRQKIASAAGVAGGIAGGIAAGAQVAELIPGMQKYAGILNTISIVAGLAAAAEGLLNIALDANPIMLVVIGLAALVAGLIYAWNHFQGFRDVVIAVWKDVQKAFDAAWNFIKPGIDWLGRAFVSVWHGMQDAWNSVGKPIFDILKEGFQLWWAAAKLVFDFFVAEWKLVWTIAKAAWNSVGQPLVDLVVLAFKLWWDGVKLVFDFFVAEWKLVWKLAEAAWTDVGKPLVDFIVASFQLWWSGIELVFNLFKAGFQLLWDGIQSLWTNVGKPIFDGIGTAISWVWSNVVQPTYNAFKTGFQDVWNGVKSLWDNVGKPIFDGIGTVITTVGGWFTGLWTGIQNGASAFISAITTTWDTIKSIFSAPITWLVNTVLDEWIIGNINKLLDTIGLKSLELPTLKLADGGPVPGSNGNGNIGNSGRGTAGFATGGPVPGYGNGDTVPAMLTPGEFVLRKSAVEAIGINNLHAMNNPSGGRSAGNDPSKKGLGGAISHVWDSVSGWVESVARDGAGAVLSGIFAPFRALINGASQVLGSGTVGQIVKQIPNNFMDQAVAWVKGKGKGADAPKAAATPAGAAVGKQSTEKLDDTQTANARAIITAGKSLGASPRDIEVAFMTALVESNMRNLTYGDRDSLGMFQQRASWGSAQIRENPIESAKLFFERLLAIKNRDSMGMGAEAQAVQVSAYPDRYAAWQNFAITLYGALTNSTVDIGATGRGTAGMATGGQVPGYGNGDTVPAMLTPGEFVIRKDAAAAIGINNLHAMNNIQKFNTGGPVLGLQPGATNDNIRALKFYMDQTDATNGTWGTPLTKALANGTKTPQPKPAYDYGEDNNEALISAAQNGSPVNPHSLVWGLIKRLNSGVFPYVTYDSFISRAFGGLPWSAVTRSAEWYPGRITYDTNVNRPYPHDYFMADSARATNMYHAWASGLQSSMGTNATGNLDSDDVLPLQHAVYHALGLPHSAALPHPWSGPLTDAEQALADSDRANALNTEWYGYLSTIASWGYSDLLDELLSKGIADGMEIAKSAAGDKDTAQQLNASLKAGKTGLAGVAAADQTNILKAIGFIASMSTSALAQAATVSTGNKLGPFTGSNVPGSAPAGQPAVLQGPGIRQLAQYLQIPDYGVVNLYDKIMAQASSTVNPALLTRLTADVTAFRSGTFYAATGGQVPGSGTGDTVPAMLTPGEFVLQKSAVAALGLDNVMAMNAAGSQKFSIGGLVQNMSGSVVPSIYGSSVSSMNNSSSVVSSGGASIVYEINTEINNPVGENSVYSMTKALQTKAATGFFDRSPVGTVANTSSAGG